jgi:hypothetical protein
MRANILMPDSARISIMLKGQSDKNFLLLLPDELLSAEKPGAEGVAGVQGGGGGGGGGVPFPVVHGMVPTVPA